MNSGRTLQRLLLPAEKTAAGSAGVKTTFVKPYICLTSKRNPEFPALNSIVQDTKYSSHEWSYPLWRCSLSRRTAMLGSSMCRLNPTFHVSALKRLLQLSVVFVQGLNPLNRAGYAYLTWTHEDGTFWPWDFLSEAV